MFISIYLFFCSLHLEYLKSLGDYLKIGFSRIGLKIGFSCSSSEVKSWQYNIKHEKGKKNIENSSSSGEAKAFDQLNTKCCCYQANQKKLTLSVKFQIKSAEKMFVKIVFKTIKTQKSKIMPRNTVPMFDYQDGHL